MDRSIISRTIIHVAFGFVGSPNSSTTVRLTTAIRLSFLPHRRCYIFSQQTHTWKFWKSAKGFGRVSRGDRFGTASAEIRTSAAA